jgi:hypothetical protein
MIIRQRKKPQNRLKPIAKGFVESKATPKKNTKNEPKSDVVSTSSDSTFRTGQSSNHSAPNIGIQRRKLKQNRLTVGRSTAARSEERRRPKIIPEPVNIENPALQDIESLTTAVSEITIEANTEVETTEIGSNTEITPS